ncbi:MAG: sensory transcriptional regulator [Acidobacteria bacterium]|nr:MAG: sensory transcriptional regulator [Acidobacteriota bacterium]
MNATMNTTVLVENPEVDFLHEIGCRGAAAEPLPHVLERIVEFVSAVVRCDACLLYVLEGDELVLRASKNPHPDVVGRLKMLVGYGITGWVAQHRVPVAVSRSAYRDARFQSFNQLPEDRYEAFLSVPILCRGRVVGVINLQHRRPHVHTAREIRLISTIGFFVGGEIEMARQESAISMLSQQLETRKLIERAKGILQRELGINEEEAYLTLQAQSRRRRKSMREIAQALILGEELKKPEEQSPN